MRRDAPSRVISDQAAPDEGPKNTETVSVASQTSERLLVRDAMAGMLVYVEEAMRMVLEMLFPNQKGVENHVSTAFETLVLQTLRRVMSSPEFVHQFSGAVIDNLGFINLVA